MEEAGEKPTNVVQITVYEDSFEVSATDGLDMLDLYLIFSGALDYLRNYAEYLETKESVTIQ